MYPFEISPNFPINFEIFIVIPKESEKVYNSREENSENLTSESTFSSSKSLLTISDVNNSES